MQSLCDSMWYPEEIALSAREAGRFLVEGFSILLACAKSFLEGLNIFKPFLIRKGIC